jgi:hypothetical protein
VSDLNDRSKPDETAGQAPAGGQGPVARDPFASSGQGSAAQGVTDPAGDRSGSGAASGYGSGSGSGQAGRAQQTPYPQQNGTWQQPAQSGKPGQYSAGQPGQYGQQNPYAQNPSAQNPYAHTPYGQTPYGQAPSAQQNPYGAPQYGQPSAYDPYGASPRNPSGAQKTSTLAILSIVFALGGVFIWPIIILTSPAGAVMGHLALGRIKQTGEQGRGLALAGIIGGWVLTGLYILIAIAVIALLAAAPGSGSSGWDGSGGGTGALVA